MQLLQLRWILSEICADARLLEELLQLTGLVLSHCICSRHAGLQYSCSIQLRGPGRHRLFCSMHANSPLGHSEILERLLRLLCCRGHAFAQIAVTTRRVHAWRLS